MALNINRLPVNGYLKLKGLAQIIDLDSVTADVDGAEKGDMAGHGGG
jgi:hypothetical protein